MSWPILTVKDRDGAPFYFVAPTLAEARTAHRKHLRAAEYWNCNMREVPVLLSKEPGPFIPGVKVTRNERGEITSIDWSKGRRRR